MNSRIFGLAAALITLAIPGVTAAVQIPIASSTTRTFSFPAFGLASSETVQVNVVNVAAAASNGTAASCGGTIAFYNSSGAVIGTASSFTVGSGQISSATLPFSTLGAAGTRHEIRAVVTLNMTAGVPCVLQSSLETYDTATGVTHFVLAGPEQNMPVITVLPSSPLMPSSEPRP